VLLPVRPSGASGWIPADAVTRSKTGYHIDVYLTAHRIVVSDGARVVDDEPIGAGRANTPTPGGEYYITELLQQPVAQRSLWALRLWALWVFNVLHAFNGGAGMVGIHGTDDPAGLGHDVSPSMTRANDSPAAARPGVAQAEPVQQPHAQRVEREPARPARAGQPLASS
jgi:hypothetical protein